MIEKAEGKFEGWQRELENYTVGLVIALIQSKRAKSLERRQSQKATDRQRRRA